MSPTFDAVSFVVSFVSASVFPCTSTAQRAMHLPQQTDWTSKEVCCIKIWTSYLAAAALRPLSRRWQAAPTTHSSAVREPQQATGKSFENFFRWQNPELNLKSGLCRTNSCDKVMTKAVRVTLHVWLSFLQVNKVQLFVRFISQQSVGLFFFSSLK